MQNRFRHHELARLAAEGGADVVQYRDKREVALQDRLATTRAMCREIAGRCRLIVNDHPQVAREARADGVHLGPADLDPQQAARRRAQRGEAADRYEVDRLQRAVAANYRNLARAEPEGAALVDAGASALEVGRVVDRIVAPLLLRRGWPRGTLPRGEER